jgi:hypothetical protein
MLLIHRAMFRELVVVSARDIKPDRRHCGKYPTMAIITRGQDASLGLLPP